MVLATRSEGGVWQDSGSRCGKPTFRYLPYSSVVIPCESARPCRTGEKEGDESDPPKKWGGHVTPDSGAEWHASIRPHAGRSRPHISLREGSETAHRRGC